MSSPLDAPLTIRRTSLHHLHPIREAHRGPNLSHCLIWRGAGERLALVDDPGRQCRSALVAGHGRETMDYPARNEEGLSRQGGKRRSKLPGPTLLRATLLS